MRFEAEGHVSNASQKLVYEIIRDQLVELVPYMDNVSSIQELKREPRGDGQHVLNCWQADAGQVPAVARKFVKPEMLKWLDYADWNDGECWVDWRIESEGLKGMYTCKGRNRVVAVGDDVAIRIQGELAVDPKRIPGVPSFLVKKVLPAIESYLISRMKPNMASLGTGVARFLAAGKG